MAQIIDELIFRSYVHNRMMSPDVSPERWAKIYRNVPEMEERFLKTFVLKLMEAAEEFDIAAGQGNTHLNESESGNEGGEGVKSVALPAQKDSLRKVGDESAHKRVCEWTGPAGMERVQFPLCGSDEDRCHLGAEHSVKSLNPDFSTFIERIQTVCAEKGI